MTDAARTMIERMKAANAKGNYGLPERVLEEWAVAQRSKRDLGEAHYTSLVDVATDRVVARI